MELIRVLFKKILKMKLYMFLWILMFLIVFIITIHIRTEKSEVPVILWWTLGFGGYENDIQECKSRSGNRIQCFVSNNRNIGSADAYLFYGSELNFTDLPLPRRPGEIFWGLYHEESPRNVEELMHEHVLSLFNFSATISRYSNVPLTFQYLELSDLTSTKYFKSTKEKNEKRISPILYLQSDCMTSTERDVYVQELMKHINIDSYGKCLNNKKLPDYLKNDYVNNLNDDIFLNFVSDYKFVIAIENGVCEDYITEKLWRPLKTGSVPIYFGSPSIRDWLPNYNSAILLQDYDTPVKLKRRLEELLKNDSQYEKYLEHKIDQIVSNKRLITAINNENWVSDPIGSTKKLECLVCEKLHEKRLGKLTGNYVVDKRHYDCPKPLSALTLKVNKENNWVSSWEMAKENAEQIYKKIINQK